jgi:hypothetical protein
VISGGFASFDAQTDIQPAAQVVTSLNTATDAARRRLRWSIWTGMVALVALALTGIVFWKGVADPDPPKFLVRYEDGSVACSELAWSDGTLTGKAAGEAGNVAEIAVVESCPQV